jgi:Mg-chelatase subunit ChlD
LIDIPVEITEINSRSFEESQHYNIYDKIVSLNIEARCESINKYSIKNSLPLMITYQTIEQEFGKNMMGVDIVLIIDISKSMEGEKIDLVRETSLFMIEELQEKDRLCLIKFDEKSEILTNLAPMNSEFKSVFKEIVRNQIQPRGNTNIGQALKDGFDVLLNRKFVNDVTAIFLVSDGEDTCGNSNSVLEEVLDINDAKMQELGMNYNIHTFGYGKYHDERILNFLSNYKSGNFYYIKDTKIIGECLIDCLGYVMSIFTQNAQIKLVLNNGVKLIKGYGSQWRLTKAKSEAEVTVGSLARGLEKNFLCEVQISDLDIQESKITIGDVKMSFTVKNQKVQLCQKLCLPINRFVDGHEKVNTRFEENLLRVKAAEALQEADDYYENGDFEKGREEILFFKENNCRNLSVPETYFSKIDRLLDEDMCEDSKSRTQLKDMFRNQSHVAGYENFCSRNNTQTEMNRKFKKGR